MAAMVQREAQIATALWTFFDEEPDPVVLREVTSALLGAAPDSPVTPWVNLRRSEPSADLYFGDGKDTLMACVELKRAKTPAQFTPVRWLDDAAASTPFRDVTGALDPVSKAVLDAASGWRRDRHKVEDDTCPGDWHTWPVRGKWSCALPQIDLYRAVGRCPEGLRQQDPNQVLWLIIADDARTPSERYHGAAISAACWATRTWHEVLTAITADQVLCSIPTVQVLLMALRHAR
jgi:hypothetical protein